MSEPNESEKKEAEKDDILSAFFNWPPLKTRTGPADKFTRAQMAAALQKAKGHVAGAAEILKTPVQTVYAYIRKYPELKDIRDAIVTRNVAVAEDKLLEKVKLGDMTAIIYYLKTFGHRVDPDYRPYLKIEADVTVKETQGSGQLLAEMISRAIFAAKEAEAAKFKALAEPAPLLEAVTVPVEEVKKP